MEDILEEMYFDKKNNLRILKVDKLNLKKYNLDSYKIEIIFKDYNSKLKEMIKFKNKFNFKIITNGYIFDLQNYEGWIVIEGIKKERL